MALWVNWRSEYISGVMYLPSYKSWFLLLNVFITTNDTASYVFIFQKGLKSDIDFPARQEAGLDNG